MARNKIKIHFNNTLTIRALFVFALLGCASAETPIVQKFFASPEYGPHSNLINTNNNIQVSRQLNSTSSSSLYNDEKETDFSSYDDDEDDDYYHEDDMDDGKLMSGQNEISQEEVAAAGRSSSTSGSSLAEILLKPLSLFTRRRKYYPPKTHEIEIDSSAPGIGNVKYDLTEDASEDFSDGSLDHGDSLRRRGRRRRRRRRRGKRRGRGGRRRRRRRGPRRGRRRRRPRPPPPEYDEIDIEDDMDINVKLRPNFIPDDMDDHGHFESIPLKVTYSDPSSSPRIPSRPPFRHNDDFSFGGGGGNGNYGGGNYNYGVGGGSRPPPSSYAYDDKPIIIDGSNNNYGGNGLGEHETMHSVKIFDHHSPTSNFGGIRPFGENFKPGDNSFDIQEAIQIFPGNQESNNNDIEEDDRGYDDQDKHQSQPPSHNLDSSSNPPWNFRSGSGRQLNFNFNPWGKGSHYGFSTGSGGGSYNSIPNSTPSFTSSSPAFTPSSPSSFPRSIYDKITSEEGPPAPQPPRWRPFSYDQYRSPMAFPQSHQVSSMPPPPPPPPHHDFSNAGFRGFFKRQDDPEMSSSIPRKFNFQTHFPPPKPPSEIQRSWSLTTPWSFWPTKPNPPPPFAPMTLESNSRMTRGFKNDDRQLYLINVPTFRNSNPGNETFVNLNENISIEKDDSKLNATESHSLQVIYGTWNPIIKKSQEIEKRVFSTINLNNSTMNELL